MRIANLQKRVTIKTLDDGNVEVLDANGNSITDGLSEINIKITAKRKIPEVHLTYIGVNAEIEGILSEISFEGEGK